MLLLSFSWLCSENRKLVDLRFLFTGLFVQILLALVFFQIPFISEVLLYMNTLVAAVEGATLEGSSFLFGYLGGGQEPFKVNDGSYLYLFAFRVLPNVIVFCVLIAVLWYWKILPAIVRLLGMVLQRIFGVSGAVGTSAASTLFLGMVETPMIIRAYLAKLTRSEFFTVMTCGMSTVAGSVMIIYANTLSSIIPGAIGHIIVGSVINIVGAIYISRIMVPEQGTPTDSESFEDLGYSSTMDAITRGTQDGLKLALNIAGMLLVIISLVALFNGLLGLINVFDAPLSMQIILGWIFSPLAWLVGIPWSESQIAGNLMGTKIVLNEMIAYIQLSSLEDSLSNDSRLILLYALCGFANFGSLGILIGGLSTLVPERKADYLSLAPKSLISGNIVTFVTAAIVSLVSFT
ncbi:nucleoside:proton symporter [Gammaproteobacteria bacterium]|nr:nucleoside:proton symporter [Gammaproteobacteria bacterium]